MGSLSLLQGIFPVQGWNPVLPHCRPILHQLSYQGSPRTDLGSLSLLQRIFPTQESNRGLLHCRRILYQLSCEGSPPNAKFRLELVKALSGTRPCHVQTVRVQAEERRSRQPCFCLSPSSLTRTHTSSSSPLFSALFSHEIQSLL